MPSDSWTHARLALDEEKAKKPTVDKIRERQEFYAQRAREAEEAS